MDRPPSPATVLDAIEAQDTDTVVAAARAAVRAGGIDLAVELLAGVQREVGLRWQRDEWNVADEHAATAIIDLALTAAAFEADAGVVATPAPRVVVACAEGEWHVLPARMLSEQLRAVGFDVVFLGASIPGAHLTQFLRTDSTTAVALSCSVAIYLPGARRTILAAHAAGIPVVAGGAAFGASADRAAALGADAWAPTAAAAAQSIAQWSDAVPRLADGVVDDAAERELALRGDDIVAAAMARLEAVFPPFAHFSDDQRERTREDFDYILQFLQAALLTGDATIVDEFVAWLASLLEARQLPPSVVPLSLRVLRECLPPELAAAAELLEKATADAGGVELP